MLVEIVIFSNITFLICIFYLIYKTIIINEKEKQIIKMTLQEKNDIIINKKNILKERYEKMFKKIIMQDYCCLICNNDNCKCD
jgi:hypothetical protein